MRWKNRRQSTNIEDRRGVPVAGAALGGGAIIIVLAALLFGADPGKVMQILEQAAPSSNQAVEQPVDPHTEELKAFVSVVLADTEDVWNQLFAAQGADYREPVLVVFAGEVESACGFASAAVGPFYCAADEHLYLDLAFLDELSSRFGATGDFPGAYVIAHEVGHHVQNLLGTLPAVHEQQQRLGGEQEANELSVRLELQADYFAGVWAHYAERTLGVLEPGDIEEALRAANAIGDDRLQMEGQGYVVPDSFTHGTSEQRMRWFTRGYESGDLAQGDTFSARQL